MPDCSNPDTQAVSAEECLSLNLNLLNVYFYRHVSFLSLFSLFLFSSSLKTMAKSNADESTSSSVSMKTNYTTTTFLPPLPPPSTDAFLTLQLADYLDMHQERTTTTDSPKHNTAFTTRETGSDSIPSPLLPRLQIHPHKNDSPSSSPPSSSSLSSLSSSSDDDACTISPLLW